MPSANIPEEYLPVHQRWLEGTFTFKQHKFCSNLCVNFTKKGAFSDQEANCMQACFNKYEKALSYFQKEKTIFAKNLENMTQYGEDKYEARDI